MASANAVSGIDMQVPAGKITGLIGPNGAGKTTLINLITGVLALSGGSIRFGDQDLTHAPAHKVARAGITRTFQNIRLLAEANVIDNVMIGFYRREPASAAASLLGLPSARRETRSLRERALRLLPLWTLSGKPFRIILIYLNVYSTITDYTEKGFLLPWVLAIAFDSWPHACQPEPLVKPVDVFAKPGSFFKGNLHTHSTLSDGKYSAQEVCAKYQAAGYDFLALTDHFLPRFDFPVSDTRAWRSDTFTTLLSAELHVPATVLKESWHILAVGLPLDFQKTLPSETAPQISRRAHAAGAFLGIVHPSWYGLTLEEVEAIDCAHAVEIYNHTGAVKHDRGDSCAFFDQLLARGRRLNAFAADDAHFHHDDAFAAWVMVKSAALVPEDLVNALKLGDYYSSQGPEITSIAVDDDVIEIGCSAAKAVMVLGRGSTAESELGSNLTHVRLPLAQLRKAGYGRVVIVAQDGKRAWSNPIWFAR